TGTVVRSRSRCSARTSPTTSRPGSGCGARSTPWPGCTPPASRRSSTPTSTVPRPTSSPSSSPGPRWPGSWTARGRCAGWARAGPFRGEVLLRRGPGLPPALHPLHEVDIVHRDLKPGNVLMVRRGGVLEPVVIDFGIAQVADDVRLTSTGLVMGTPGYLSPEV